jgi:hypothetical protein
MELMLLVVGSDPDSRSSILNGGGDDCGRWSESDNWWRGWRIGLELTAGRATRVTVGFGRRPLLSGGVAIGLLGMG